jgi:hypothetical protein
VKKLIGSVLSLLLLMVFTVGCKPAETPKAPEAPPAEAPAPAPEKPAEAPAPAQKQPALGC